MENLEGEEKHLLTAMEFEDLLNNSREITTVWSNASLKHTLFQTEDGRHLLRENDLSARLVTTLRLVLFDSYNAVDQIYKRDDPVRKLKGTVDERPRILNPSFEDNAQFTRVLADLRAYQM